MTDLIPARLVPPEPGQTGRSHWRVEPEGLAVIEELAGRGCHVATIARVLGMGRDAFRECRRRQPEVEEAYQSGLGREHDALVGNLRQAADEGNVAASIYLLKARHGLWDQPTPHSATNVNVNVESPGVLVVPQRQSMEEFLAERRDAGMLPNAPRIDTVERVPGERRAPDPDLIEGRLDPETRRGD